MNTKTSQNQISTFKEGVIISQGNKKKNCAQIKKLLKSLQGSLKDVPEFQGMNGVDLQHYIVNDKTF